MENTTNNAVISSIQDFMAKNDFVSVEKNVRINANTYPFVSFYTSKNVCENIYFSKAASLLVAAKDPVNKELFSKLRITEYKNELGEPRIKLCSAGESNRAEIGDLF